ncbi:uncharacterized protein LOC131859189 [Cryptomeria japonica]|uniref:uncharacterized protein LOC131859189 n=1 Tax=Cryptomeria japonica TaxID=3369 RepID=UPI0027DA6A41|nr:uncharacterized protein LOC131859189 [Cryptomeria japonica]
MKDEEMIVDYLQRMDETISAIRRLREEFRMKLLSKRKLKRGSGKYKGKLPFKCFNCGNIGHFASKCPYGENNEDGKKTMKSFGKEKMKNYYKTRRRSYKNKNNLYTFENDASDEKSVSEDFCSEGEREINLFMAQGELFDEHIVDDEEEEIEAKVYLEIELISALEELRKVRR